MLRTVWRSFWGILVRPRATVDALAQQASIRPAVVLVVSIVMRDWNQRYRSVVRHCSQRTDALFYNNITRDSCPQSRQGVEVPADHDSPIISLISNPASKLGYTP